jgi:hypothetical protein
MILGCEHEYMSVCSLSHVSEQATVRHDLFFRAEDNDEHIEKACMS